MKYIGFPVTCLLLSTASLAAQPASHEFTRSFDVAGMDIVVHSKTGAPHQAHPVSIEIRKDNGLTINQTHAITGVLKKARIADLDRDDNPEIMLWARVPGTGKYGRFTLFEVEGSSLRAATLPSLPDSLNYAGHDKISLSSTHVVRTFPTYAKGNPLCCPTGPMVEIVYAYEQGQVVVEEIRKLFGDRAGARHRAQTPIAFKNEELSCELLARGLHDGLCMGGFVYASRLPDTGLHDNRNMLRVAYTTPIHAAASLTIPIDGEGSLSCRNPDVAISSADARIVFAVAHDDDPRTQCTISYTRDGFVVSGTFEAVMKARHETYDPDAQQYKQASGAFRVTLAGTRDYISATVAGKDYRDTQGFSVPQVLDVEFRPVDNRFPHFRRGRNTTDMGASGRHWTIHVPEIDFSGSGEVRCANVQDYSSPLIRYSRGAGSEETYTAAAGGHCTIKYQIDPSGVVTGTFSGTLTPSDGASGGAALTVTGGEFRFYLPDGPTS